MSETDEFTTMQAALAFGGFKDAAETERVTLWAAEEIQRLQALVTSLRKELGERDDFLYQIGKLSRAYEASIALDAALNTKGGPS